MRGIFTGIFLLIIVFKAGAQPVTRSMLRLPDTGVTSGYTATFGEDNDYNCNTPYFIVNTNSTVTDSITGLMWQQADGGEMTIENAELYCDTLSLGGYMDWRLPTAHEAFSILNHQYANPALDTAVFTKTLAQYWWTSNRQANDSNKVWVTNSGGGIGNHHKTETISAGGAKRMHIRAVRENNPPQQIPFHFSDNGDGTITDHFTGLTWQKSPHSDTLTWEDALQYSDSLSVAGYSDWRLPNIKELRSISQEQFHHPSVDTGLFDIFSGQRFWSCTTLRNQPTKAWYLDSQFGITTYDFKTNRHEVICVRGNMVSTFVSDLSGNHPYVYPNPFTTFIKINNTGPGTSYQLFDAEGRLIYAGKDLTQIDATELSKGIYLLIVRDRITTIHKLVKN